MQRSYPTDLTNEQWDLLQPLLPSAKTTGRPRSTDLRAVINAIFYILMAGCAWRMLPHDFPPYQTVYHYFRVWRLDKTWEKIHNHLVRWERVAQGHHSSPSAASMDSQSVKISSIAGYASDTGYDGGKKIKGRKRHLLVDTLGLVMMVVVTAANTSDQQGARLIFERLSAWPERLKRLILIWVDGTYEGADFMKWTMDTYHWILETIKRSDNTKGFVLLPKRWVVERTWGWLNWSRRLAKDYEVWPETSEAFIYIAMIRIMLRRLA
jgi:putative transposase